ncbi:MAG TPA: GAF domain-containing protein [Ktedonobacterales bacterium]
MNASAQAVDARRWEETGVRYAVKSSRPTRPVYGPHSNQATNELTETLKRIMASATALLGVTHCWIAGLDLASQKLIPIASLAQNASDSGHQRASLQQRVAGWVTANRVPALINNMLNDPRCQGSGPALGGSMLCVPLLSGQQLLGTITVSSPVPGIFQPQATKILQLLADQTVLAISKARQIEASQQQAHELSTLLDVARAMTSTLDTTQMLRAIATQIRRLVSCDDVVLFGVAEEARELRALVRLGAYNAPLEDLRIPLDDKQSLVAWVAQNRRPILQSPGGRVFVGRITGILLGADDLALLGAPLLSKDQLRGVLMLGRFTPFTTNELRVVLNLSTIVAIAMEDVDMQKL